MMYITRNLILITPFFIISIPFVIIHRILEIKKRQYLGIKTTSYKEVGVISLMYSLILIGIVTFGTSINFFDIQYIAQHINESIKNINFIPFKGMIEFGVHGFINIFGNIFIFMPFGFCAALLSRKEKKIKHIVLVGIGISLGIEIIQIFIVRSSDINDLILNTLGTFLGLSLLNLFEKYFPDFVYKFTINKPKNEVTIKNNRKINIITILQIAIWITLLVNLRDIAMGFYQFKFLK
ncbi:VanZ family protein [Clostridium sp.]|uniref:VanZ family protein n=1 Tax=Clostridium sp. TaxID=1506 RepID=UPI001A3FEE00|nr:VanZ family protein [Clostridium sp.]MBK5241604.1 VanZ family protein [Clostridium sp.]